MSSLHALRSLPAGSSMLARPHPRPSLSTSRLLSASQPKSRCGERSFHTPAMLSTIVQDTPDFLVGIHAATHTPWFLTIPLIALGVSVVFRLPFNLYSQKIVERRSKCNTVLQAWSTRIQLDVRQEDVPPSRRSQEVSGRFHRARKRLYGKLGLQDWKLWSTFLTFPFWIVAVDGVRRLCGGPRGVLLSKIFGSKGVNGEGLGASAGEGLEATSPSSLMAGDSVGSVSPVDPSTTSGAAETIRQVLDPSLASEGCLWFPDLTVADPYYILPLLMSASLVANMIPKSRDSVRELFGLEPVDKQGAPSPLDRKAMRKQGRQLALRRALLLLAAIAGPATADLPSAVHLYCISSVCVNMASVAILHRLMPLKLMSHDICQGVELPIIRAQQYQGGVFIKR